ncbi:ArfGap-domain-containing protein [Laetiporus sulphureus 93-53]|uniref:ArfGap-domain-containing protein n=1 Tax=Laetiporus sulphureus 93-53 TaxID=1314785 RepID=A0A165FIJ2_9APHY|nr:ArfGap-domain-containing protein [Laetiporus sulphureus 93-53]KZT09023.1 ArfGap-domain-containing protein [Laetiporus sulphureus 93-53]
MSRQDKAITERHAKQLREMLKRPDNKVCADCKRNDPRWASWNIGVFLCIRCSGIHRSMGTHISRIKSVDLDIWTPEQMESIQKWGNRLANLYWEAHLKPGHIPADHKMESFIRSKYESRRWAMEGPPPSDPSSLESQAPSTPVHTPAAAAAAAVQTPPAPRTSTPVESKITATASRLSSISVSRQPQPHQLLSASVANRSHQAQTAPPAQAQSQAPAATHELFSLDFHAPAAPPSQPEAEAAPAKKDAKQDILSLYSKATSPAVPSAAFGQFTSVQAAWGAFDVQAAQQTAASPVTSMTGTTGVGMWGTSSGWTGAPAAAAQPSIWSSPASQPAMSQQSLFTTSDVWGSSGGGTAAEGHMFSSSVKQKKDDAFGDIWGGFK